MARSGKPGRRALAPLLCLGVAPLAVAVALAAGHDPRRAEASSPLHARDADYVGASACQACHPDHFASWRRTYHSTMTQLPRPSSVLGRFDGAGGHAVWRDRDAGRARRTVLLRAARVRRRAAARGRGRARRRLAPLPAVLRAQRRSERRQLPAPAAALARRRAALDAPQRRVPRARQRRLGRAPGGLERELHFLPQHGHRPRPARRRRAAGSTSTRTWPISGSPARPATARRAITSRVTARSSSVRAPSCGRSATNDVVDPPRLGQAAGTALCGQCHSQRLPDPLGQALDLPRHRARPSGRAVCSTGTSSRSRATRRPPSPASRTRSPIGSGATARRA